MQPYLKMTKPQLQKVAALAVNASQPMGMGYLQYQADRVYQPEEFDLDARGMLHLDYVGGRMVKLTLKAVNRGSELWVFIPEREPRHDYQSWVREYPSWKALFEAAGVTYKF